MQAEQERAQVVGAYDGTGPVAVWPSLKAAGRVATIFAAGALVGIMWSPGSPFEALRIPAISLPPLPPVTGLREPAAAVVHAPVNEPMAAPAAPAATTVPLAPVPAAPAAPVTKAALAAAEAQVPAPAPEPAPARPAWRPPDVPRVPYPERVERWRPIVQMILAEMWAEGRLDGNAARLDDDLVLALIEQESAGRPDATSWVGAIGLMQVMPFTFAEMMAGDKALADAIPAENMYDLTSNVRAGLRYLALAMNATEGNLYWALAAYNGGIEAVDAWRAVGLYAVPPIGGYEETANYAQVILRNYLAHRPDVQLHVPDPMPHEHVPGAVQLLLDSGRYEAGCLAAAPLPSLDRARTVLQRLAHMGGGDFVGAVQIGDGPGQLEHAVVGARGEPQALDRGLEQRLGA